MVRYPFYNWQNGFARRSPDHYPTVYPHLFLHITPPLCRMFRFSGHPVLQIRPICNRQPRAGQATYKVLHLLTIN